MPKAKIIVLFVVIVLLLGGAGVYWRVYTQSEGYQAEKFVKEWEQRYRDDTIGGQTPEETLQLFIEALKAGDTELAARYFIVDEQEQWREDLARLKERGLLEAMIKDIEKAERGRDISEDSTRFTVTNENKEVITIIHISRGLNGVWKIVDF